MAKTGLSMKNSIRSISDTASQSQQISPEERQRMIAEAAYFRAMQRGFSDGDTVDDWLVAEAEINRLLPNSKQR